MEAPLFVQWMHQMALQSGCTIWQSITARATTRLLPSWGTLSILATLLAAPTAFRSRTERNVGMLQAFLALTSQLEAWLSVQTARHTTASRWEREGQVPTARASFALTTSSAAMCFGRGLSQ